MTTSIEIAPPNSLLLIMDRSWGVVPESMGTPCISATSSCVAVGTYPAPDGSTNVTIDGTPPSEAPPSFDGTIETPNKTVSVCTTLDEVVHAQPVETERTRLRIWLNDLHVPDRIVIVISSA
jgi:hypothetical protein